jgi:hypothetical protein
MKTLWSLSALLLLAMVLVPAGLARAEKDDDDEQDPAALAKALGPVKVTLEAGLAAASSQGKPISAKFELEDGKLQLSVYTEKGGKFSEVAVDDSKGTVAKSEPITEGEDLSDAKAQSAAMAKAKRSLHDAVVKAVGANKGFRAVSVVPETKDGHTAATITLLNGQDWKTVTEPLD